MKARTVELQRFGDPTGVARLSDRYLRAVDAQPTDEVGLRLTQEALARGMACLHYQRLQGAANPGAIRDVAEDVFRQLTPLMAELLPVPDPTGELVQLDVVSRALELAQLPFELLEEEAGELVVTRRIRQPWPRPPVVRSPRPKVLFAWAGPAERPNSRRVMAVPHERHRALLHEVLFEWIESDPSTLAELPNVTLTDLRAALCAPDHGFTHVHLLAHGVDAGPVDKEARVDLFAPSAGTTYLALADDDGVLARHSAEALAGCFPPGVPRPGAFVIASCHSGEVDPTVSGGTLAHAVHGAGVPVVLGSQLALTQAGSDLLITSFLKELLAGTDPRLALRRCRDGLRADPLTYYDRVALVGYVHLEEDFERRQPALQFRASFERLKAASRAATDWLERCVGEPREEEAASFDARFDRVRSDLRALDAPGLPREERAELYGLLASSLKREAEAAFALAQRLDGERAQRWAARSEESLRKAGPAYGAARLSRDHHWVWVQWLVSEALVGEGMAERAADWTAARVAALDVLEACDGSHEPSPALRKDAAYACGSLVELGLLAPLLRPAAVCPDEELHGWIDRVRQSATEDPDPLGSLLRQLNRYVLWWGAEPGALLPETVVQQARVLRDRLSAPTP